MFKLHKKDPSQQHPFVDVQLRQALAMKNCLITQQFLYTGLISRTGTRSHVDIDADGADGADDLRKRAQESLQARPLHNAILRPEPDMSRQLHELQVQQIDLEMPNLKLLEPRAVVSARVPK